MKHKLSDLEITLIQMQTCAEFSVSMTELLSARRGGGICVPRHLAMTRAHDAGADYHQIGRAFGRDHSTVMHAVAKTRGATV